ncbi:hypothetical protein [Aeromicrobium alkaliterrae]|uniref:Integral membrane protein n=1 Tax=Aeromicrobium alkaliterrae TaxID=302168 RepID=A0ABN2KC68_9ACTN
MSHPHVPSYAMPYPPPQVSRATHPVDMVLSVFGWVVLAAGSGFLALLSPASLLAGLACGPNHAEPAICTDAGGSTYALTVVGGLIVLFLACTVSLIGLIVALARGGRAWPWVVAGHVVAACATLVFVGVAVAVTS